ncbi:MAG: (4Fe-4S)-binding protein [Bacteroidetes bacterium QH_8_67_23]|nr:MAG: (4Fe-4S)-binding protein [Bacteroidetes bacterium QH_8_67_23]
MAQPSRTEKAAEIRRLMDAEGAAVAENTQGFNAGRYRSTAELTGYEDLKARAREIKEDAIARLPELIDRLTERVEANGGTVYFASDAADANRHITTLCQEQREARGNDRPLRLVKSKSMTTEEIEVNEALEEEGVEVVETDLGEWVLQLAGEAPSHIVAPAIHKSRKGIADLFKERFETDESLETAEELTVFARERLGDLIEGADVGMTGANFIVAETGTLCLVTSEGNARKSAVVPPTHIAVAGVEKILPRVEDLQPFVELIGRSGTGQDLTSYFSMLTPPYDAPAPNFSDPDQPVSQDERERAFHLVLIDNGRLAMREDDPLRETLYCIRCGACANTCANFQQVGGHAFGGETYSGGIATGWEAGVHGPESAASFNDLCTGCSRCVPACPVGIDIPWINTVVRSRINEGKDQSTFGWLARGLRPDGPPGEDDAGFDLQKRVFARFGSLARLGSRTAPLSNWVSRSKAARALMERALGIDRRRALPQFRRETLAKWFAKRDARPPENEADVALYADAYSNFVRTERGKAAVRALEAVGGRVHLAGPTESGRAPLSQGRIDQAEKQAKKTHAALAEHLDAGRPVVVIEPTDLAMLRRDYEKLLSPEAAERIEEQSIDVMAYLNERIEEGGRDVSALRQGEGRKVFYHSHCQQRTLGLEGPAVALLETLGYDVQTSDEIECCGMAGSFGYKREYYELSMKVGERLGAQWAETGERPPVASGTSCQEQLEALTGRPARHAVELVAPGA